MKEAPLTRKNGRGGKGCMLIHRRYVACMTSGVCDRVIFDFDDF